MAKFLELKIDTLNDVLVAESAFPAMYAAVQANVKVAFELTQGELFKDPVAVAKLIAVLGDANEQFDDLVTAKKLAETFKKVLETPVPTEPIEPPVVIEVPTPIEVPTV